MNWSYERSVFYKGFECFYESGPQTLLQTYVQMRTKWVDMQALQALLEPLKKGYILNGGNQHIFAYEDLIFLLIYSN